MSASRERGWGWAAAGAGVLLGLVQGAVCAVPPPEDSAAFPAPPAAGYAWEALARRAAERSGEAKALLEDAAAERFQTAVDTAWRDPQLRLGLGQGETDEETAGRLATRVDPLQPLAPPEPDLRPREWETRDSDDYEVGLRVYIVNPFVNRWLREQGVAAARSKEAESREAAYAVFCEVRSLCLEAASLREELDLLERIATFRTQARDIRSRQAAAAVAGALDLIEAVTRAAEIREEIRGKEEEHRRLVRRIALLADVPAEGIRLRPPAAEFLPAAGWEVEALVDLAMERRPDLARARHDRTAATHGLRAAQAGLLPWFDYVEGSYAGESTQGAAYEDGTTGYDTTDQDRAEWQLRLAVNIPIFDWDGKEVRLSRARLSAADARLQTLHARIRAEIAGVLDAYARACAARARLADENRKARALMDAKIDALAQEPTVPPEDLLEAREAVADYARILLRADRECRRLAQELETVTGGPLDEPR